MNVLDLRPTEKQKKEEADRRTKRDVMWREFKNRFPGFNAEHMIEMQNDFDRIRDYFSNENKRREYVAEMRKIGAELKIIS